MPVSSSRQISGFYDQTADSYSAMMDTEIELPLYDDVLSRLSQRIESLSGFVLDTSCGSGHMLFRYRQKFDLQRSLVGIDLSPRMIEASASRLNQPITLHCGDMRDLSNLDYESTAAVISFFAIHHLDLDSISTALAEWYRVLKPRGQLLLATWEGTGPIDYGESSDIIAYRYSKNEIVNAVRSLGFCIERCVVEAVEDFPMDAIYLEASKPSKSSKPSSLKTNSK